MTKATNMTSTPAWRRYLTFWRTPFIQDVDDELRFHTNMRVHEYIARGMSEAEARGAVADRLGDLPAARAECIELGRARERNARNVGMIDDLGQDIRFAGRQFRRNPAFAALAIVTLALGIGANTAIFSIVHRVLLDPLPFPDGSRIVMFSTGPEHETNPQFQFVFDVPMSAMRRLEAQSATVTEVSAVSSLDLVIASGAHSDTVNGAAITASFFPMLRAHVAVGRAFEARDAHRGAPPVALIGYELWQQRYGGAPDVLGKVITVDQVPRMIVGITPPGLDVPIASRGSARAIWLPLDLDSAPSAGMVFGRLMPGATSSAAARELQSYLVQTPEYAKYRGRQAYAATALDFTGSDTRQAIEILFVTVCGLLLIACANLANLLFMRGWARQRELAVRRALGAGRLRLVRQLLTESLALSLMGGGLGLLVAWFGLRLGRGPDERFRLIQGSEYMESVHIDRTVLVWTLALSILTGLVFGVGPALWSGVGSESDALRVGVRGMAGSSAARRVRGGLVVGEIALSLSFLIAAALLVRSFITLESTPIGYDPRSLVAVVVRVAHPPPPASRLTLDRDLVRALRAVPGVQEAAIGQTPQTYVGSGPFAIEGPTGPQTLDLSLCEMPFIDPSYFHVARIALVEGRTFGSLDDPATAHELVVNQSLAHRLWPNRDPLGARLRVGKDSSAVWLTVVGVAHDLHLAGTSGDLFNLQMYRPVSAARGFVAGVLVRLRAPVRALEPSLRRAVEGAGIGATLRQTQSIESMIDERVLARPRRGLVVFAMFAVVALTLSAVGLYGVIAYAVTQRTREIGVRVALGADPAAVARLILGDSGLLIVVGVGLGLAIAYAATSALAAFLYGIQPTDPAAFVCATVLLVVVALVASLAPTRRALRIDPMEALRTE